MIPTTAADQAQHLAPWVPRRVLVAYVANLVHRHGYGRVITRDGRLTGLACDFIHDAARKSTRCLAC